MLGRKEKQSQAKNMLASAENLKNEAEQEHYRPLVIAILENQIEELKKLMVEVEANVQKMEGPITEMYMKQLERFNNGDLTEEDLADVQLMMAEATSKFESRTNSGVGIQKQLTEVQAELKGIQNKGPISEYLIRLVSSSSLADEKEVHPVKLGEFIAHAGGDTPNPVVQARQAAREEQLKQRLEQATPQTQRFELDAPNPVAQARQAARKGQLEGRIAALTPQAPGAGKAFFAEVDAGKFGKLAEQQESQSKWGKFFGKKPVQEPVEKLLGSAAENHKAAAVALRGSK